MTFSSSRGHSKSARDGFIGTIVVAIISAAVFVGAARLLTRRTVRA